jgi:hypothetical protein
MERGAGENVGADRLDQRVELGGHFAHPLRAAAEQSGREAARVSRRARAAMTERSMVTPPRA